MFLFLGGETSVSESDIIGIFDLDTSTVSMKTRDFLARSERGGNIVNVSYELPKTFILCEKNGQSTVYISQISSPTLQKRAANIQITERKKNIG